MVDYEYDGYCNAIRFPPSFSRIQCLVSINHAELSIFSLLVAIFVALLLEKASLIYSLFCYFRLSLSRFLGKILFIPRIVMGIPEHTTGKRRISEGI